MHGSDKNTGAKRRPAIGLGAGALGIALVVALLVSILELTPWLYAAAGTILFGVAASSVPDNWLLTLMRAESFDSPTFLRHCGIAGASIGLPIGIASYFFGWYQWTFPFAGATLFGLFLGLLYVMIFGTPRSVVRRIQQPLGQILVLGVGFSVLLPLYGKMASLRFYEAASQIVPLILVVLAVEGRAFVLRRRTEIHKLPALFTLTSLILGEFASLEVLADHRNSHPYSYGFVAGALAVGFLAVGMYSVLGFGANPDAEP